MIPNLAEIIIIIAATPALILLMFLPAFVELKKPKDCGPRMIPMENSAINLLITRFIPFANIEDEQNFDSSLIQKMAKIVEVLPSLEV
jgi:hypothetical protein